MDIVLGLLSALCFGVADFMVRFSTRRLGVYRTIFYMQCVGFLALTLYLLATGEFAHLVGKMQWQSWLWGLLAACISAISYICLYRAFAIGQLAVVSPIASSYAVVTVVLSVLSGEKLVLVQILGIVAVLVGVVFASLQKEMTSNGLGDQKEGQRPSWLPPGVLWAIFAAFSLGLTFWLLGFAVTPVLGETLPIWLFRLVTACVIAPLAINTRQQFVLPRGSVLGLVVGIGVLDTVAFIFSTLGFAIGQVAVVSVLSSLYSAVTILLAWIFLKEKLRVIQWTGISLLLIGIALAHI